MKRKIVAKGLLRAVVFCSLGLVMTACASTGTDSPLVAEDSKQQASSAEPATYRLRCVARVREDQTEVRYVSSYFSVAHNGKPSWDDKIGLRVFRSLVSRPEVPDQAEGVRILVAT